MIEMVIHKNWHRLLLVILLLLIVAYNYFGEYCALGDGYGWDGSAYYRSIVENGWSEYVSDKISYYHTHRMLPFLLTHALMRMFSVSFSPHHVMLFSSGINVLLLLASVYCFFSISCRMGWRRKTEMLGFAFCFYHYHVLKFMGYCPVMTDMPAFFLAWWIAYGYFLCKWWVIVLAGMVSIVVFPLLSLVALLLLAFRTHVPVCDAGRGSKVCQLAVRSLFVSWLPMAFVLYVVFRWVVRNANSFQDIFIARSPINVVMAVVALVAYVVFYCLATKPLGIDWLLVLKNYAGKRRLASLLLALLIFVVLYQLPTLHGFAGPFSLVNEFAQICQFPATDVLVFIETHFLYLGLGFIFILVYWKGICKVTKQLGLGYYLLTLLALLFLSDIETRKVICFYLFMQIPLLCLLDKVKISKSMVVIVLLLQLVGSFFWMPVNVAGISQAFESYQVGVYMQWPAQRYYMFQGPWQSHEVYGIALLVELVLAFLLYRWSKSHPLSC